MTNEQDNSQGDPKRARADLGAGLGRARTLARWLRRASLGHRVVPLGLALGAALVLGFGFAAVGTAQTKFIPVSDIKPGMKGYGLTVFSGTKPTRFDVEVISVLESFKPGQELIIVKTEHPRLKIAHTVAGMSGSPIYLDGRMAGAYAYGWYFGSEPVAGVTPIENMMDVLRQPIPKSLAPTAGRAPLPGASGRAHATRQRTHRFAGDPLTYDVHEHAEQVAQRISPSLAAPSGYGLGPASTTIMTGGLTAKSHRLAAELLEPAGFQVLQGGGTGGMPAAKPSGERFVDGGVLGVQLIRGDVSISGLGTVTHVVGDRLIGFGHPMMNGGFTAFPAALGKVHWILATQNRSFKIGEPTEPLGTLVNDRQAAIVVEMNRPPAVIPLRLDVKGVVGGAHPLWNMELSHDEFLGPMIVAVAMGNAVQVTTSERSNITWRARTKVDVAGHGTIEFNDFDSTRNRNIGPGSFIRSQLVRGVGALFNNPWEPVKITGIKSEIQVALKREVVWLRGSQLLEGEIEAGQPARIRLTLEHFRGGRHTKVIEVPIPRHMAGETVEIQIEPGYRVDRILPDPENLRELIAMLPKQRFDGESIVAHYRVKNEGAAVYRGRVATRLPAFAVDTLRPTTQSLAPEVFAAVRQLSFPIRGFMVGKDTVRVKVREVLR